MSKITFRADDDLVTRLEERQESKSEIMREALRAYLDGNGDAPGAVSDVDDVIADRTDDPLANRVDDLIAERLEVALDDRLADRLDDEFVEPRSRQTTYTQDSDREVTVNVSLEGVSADAEHSEASTAEAATPNSVDVAGTQDETESADTTCEGCGERLPEDHIYCPSCGEKRSHRVFCECGDELRSDWSFCPGCGRRTPAADVLETQ